MFAAISFCLASLTGFSQDTTLSNTASSSPPSSTEPDYVWIFSSPKLINLNTVELVPRRVLEFKVTHNFGDIGGDHGGITNFFGLDNAADVRIGFQYGLSKKINLIAARARGASLVQQQYELGIKYRIMQQAKDAAHPFSLAIFANNVISTMKANKTPNLENSFSDFSDRNSQTLQLLVGRRFGKLSLQLNPTYVHRNYVVDGDDNSIFAIGGGLRVPLKGVFSLIVDYSHSFRSQSSIDLFKTQDVRFYDALGVGVEILTAGHSFHLNFTNATELLENRYIPRTVSSWTKGEFRWGFTISRDFNFKKKKKIN